MADALPLILASSSPFRRELLQRLALEFRCAAPKIDETPQVDESPRELALRLAEGKARKVAAEAPRALIIGSDQVVVSDGRLCGKPGNHANAVQQLRAASGRTLTFLTALCLYNSATGHGQSAVIPCAVTFRTLTASMIEDYLQRERPYQCAGAFKSEALGIALVERISGDDPSALIGLPLIELVTMLQREGVAVLGD